MMPGTGIMNRKYSTGNQAARKAAAPLSMSSRAAATTGWAANSSTEMSKTRPMK